MSEQNKLFRHKETIPKDLVSQLSKKKKGKEVIYSEKRT